MKRRSFLRAGVVVASSHSTMPLRTFGTMQNTQNTKNRYYLLTSYETRNDLKPNRLLDFLQQTAVPFLKKSGIEKIGVFRGQTGFTTPGVITLAEFESLQELQNIEDKLLSDKEYQIGLSQFETNAEFPYVRYERSILKAFAGYPQIALPSEKLGADNKPINRIFEFRTYESRSSLSLHHKIEMFNQEEIKIFRDCDFAPIFFGETVVGSRMPSLRYIVAFDSMEHRDQSWAKFVSNPDFNRIKTKPNWTDSEAVSNIRSSFLRALPFSTIR